MEQFYDAHTPSGLAGLNDLDESTGGFALPFKHRDDAHGALLSCFICVFQVHPLAITIF